MSKRKQLLHIGFWFYIFNTILKLFRFSGILTKFSFMVLEAKFLIIAFVMGKNFCSLERVYTEPSRSKEHRKNIKLKNRKAMWFEYISLLLIASCYSKYIADVDSILTKEYITTATISHFMSLSLFGFFFIFAA